LLSETYFVYWENAEICDAIFLDFTHAPKLYADLSDEWS